MKKSLRFRWWRTETTTTEDSRITVYHRFGFELREEVPSMITYWPVGKIRRIEEDEKQKLTLHHWRKPEISLHRSLDHTHIHYLSARKALAAYLRALFYFHPKTQKR